MDHRSIDSLVLEITISIISLLREDVFDNLIYLLSQPNHDVLAPLYLLPHDHCKLAWAVVNAYRGLMANFAVVRSADVDNGDRDMGSENARAGSVLYEEGDVACVRGSVLLGGDRAGWHKPEIVSTTCEGRMSRRGLRVLKMC